VSTNQFSDQIDGSAALDRPAPLIVVGVDGSDQSSAALTWAAEEARLRGGTLKVVHAWNVPTVEYASYIPTAFADLGNAASIELDAQIAEVLGPDPDVPLEREVREGPPAQAILDAAKDASLLVVGSRGRGGFAGLLLGSVSTQVTHHAHCPVTVVRT
jgi:nucleotide-binding universal stress UspA family protein